MSRAACLGMAPSRKAIQGKTDEDGEPLELVDPFFPGRNQSITPAQHVCLSCDVRRACRSYRKRVGAEYGVWAGDHQKPARAKESTTEDDDE